jgi:hypothetical protein
MMKEIRRLILANPESVIDSPLAAQIMLGDSLASDLAFQMKVFLIVAWLIVAFAILGTRCSTNGYHILPSIVWQ